MKEEKGDNDEVRAFAENSVGVVLSIIGDRWRKKKSTLPHLTNSVGKKILSTTTTMITGGALKTRLRHSR